LEAVAENMNYEREKADIEGLKYSLPQQEITELEL
jgi:hypothetical protein